MQSHPDVEEDDLLCDLGNKTRGRLAWRKSVRREPSYFWNLLVGLDVVSFQALGQTLDQSEIDYLERPECPVYLRIKKKGGS